MCDVKSRFWVQDRVWSSRCSGPLPHLQLTSSTPIPCQVWSGPGTAKLSPYEGGGGLGGPPAPATQSMGQAWQLHTRQVLEGPAAVTKPLIALSSLTPDGPGIRGIQSRTQGPHGRLGLPLLFLSASTTKQASSPPLRLCHQTVRAPYAAEVLGGTVNQRDTNNFGQNWNLLHLDLSLCLTHPASNNTTETVHTWEIPCIPEAPNTYHI